MSTSEQSNEGGQATAYVKVLITGSRKWWDTDSIWSVLDGLAKDYEEVIVIHGNAHGADTVAKRWTKANTMPEMRFPARWQRFGKAAGMRRNRLMFDVTQPDVVLAFPLADSIGTWGMVKYAREKGCAVLVHEHPAARGEGSDR